MVHLRWEICLALGFIQHPGTQWNTFRLCFSFQTENTLNFSAVYPPLYPPHIFSLDQKLLQVGEKNAKTSIPNCAVAAKMEDRDTLLRRNWEAGNSKDSRWQILTNCLGEKFLYQRHQWIRQFRCRIPASLIWKGILQQDLQSRFEIWPLLRPLPSFRSGKR